MDKVTPIGTDKVPAKRRSRSVSSQQWPKAVEAYDLRIAGKSLSEIAEIIGVSDPQDVQRLLTERYNYDASYLTQSARDSILALELARCDKLQDACWAEAMTGEPRAIDSAIKVMAHRAKIVGLEKVDPVVQKNLVLVMGEKESDYIEALKRVSDD